MVQPINYMAAMPYQDLSQQFTGLAEALAMREQRATKEREQQRTDQIRAQYADDLKAAFANPTQETWARMIAKYPGQREAFGDVAKIHGKERVDNEFSHGAQISTALENGAVDVAKKQLSTIIKGFENSGKPAGIYKQIYDKLEAGDIKAAQAVTNMSLSLLDPDKFKKVIENQSAVEEEKRKSELHPSNLSKTSAEAVIKIAEAKFAPEKFGAELGLTQAQIDASKAARRASDASAAKSGAEARRANAEAGQMTAGVIPAEKRPEAEGKFRKEYSDQTKGYQDIKSAYGRVLSSEDSAVGDLSLIFGYMKMLDPGSVVREGEFANAQNAAGVPDRVMNLYNKVARGDRLNDSQRKAFKGQAGKLYQTAQQQEGQVRKGIERIAKGYGLKPENIFYTETETAPTEPHNAAAVTAVPAAGSVRVTAPNGQVLAFPNQQAAESFKKAAGIR